MTELKLNKSISNAPLLGDHPALDLLNTNSCSYGKKIDYWENGESVLKWLQAAFPGAVFIKNMSINTDTLLAKACSLRELSRDLIVKRKNGEPIDIAALNVFLNKYETVLNLDCDDGSYNLTLSRKSSENTIDSLLGLMAESVARLLAEGDFSLVKQCQHPSCVLWFYDRTRSHRRRWCSMSTCGNKSKAARFRERTAE